MYTKTNSGLSLKEQITSNNNNFQLYEKTSFDYSNSEVSCSRLSVVSEPDALQRTFQYQLDKTAEHQKGN